MIFPQAIDGDLLDCHEAELNDLYRYFHAARALAFADPVIHFLAELFGSATALIQSLTFWKSSEQPMHQDFVSVHHHSPLGHLTAVWISRKDIHEDAGPLVYYKGSHLLQPSQFFHWLKNEILASRDAPAERGQSYTRHLQTLLRDQGWQPSIDLPRRGDVPSWHTALMHGGTTMLNPSMTRRSYVCHYTAASHKALAGKRIGGGFDFSGPPSLPESIRSRPFPARLAGAARRHLQRLFPGGGRHA